MPDSMSQERRQLLKIYNADIILTPGVYGMEAAINTAREMLDKGNNYFMPDQFTNPANPLAHYETTGAEILEDFPYDRIDALVAGIGTGGTIIGITRRLREKYPDVKTFGVEPPTGDTIQGLKCLEGLVELPPFLDLSLISERPRVTSRQATETTRQLLEKDGVFAGVSSGAVVYQAIKVASEMDEGNIVVVLADGGWKYLSMDFW